MAHLKTIKICPFFDTLFSGNMTGDTFLSATCIVRLTQKRSHVPNSCNKDAKFREEKIHIPEKMITLQETDSCWLWRGKQFNAQMRRGEEGGGEGDTND